MTDKDNENYKNATHRHICAEELKGYRVLKERNNIYRVNIEI